MRRKHLSERHLAGITKVALALLRPIDMSKTCLPLLVATLLTLTLACGGADTNAPAPGDEVTIEMSDGSRVTGRVTQKAAGVNDSSVGSMPDAPKVTSGPDTASSLGETPVTSRVVSEAVKPAPTFTEVTVPAGTQLYLELDSALASDVSRVEDPVRARITRAVVIDGIAAIPDGSVVHGTVTTADPSGKVKGRAKLAFRFDQIDIDSDQYALRSETAYFEAKGTKTEDAKKIGIGAGAGALIGGLLGGGKGAGAGAAIGGGAGTAMVLTTAGEEVELRPGTSVEIALDRELVVLVPQG